MIKKIKLLFNTLKYLKWVQIRYRLYYFIRNRIIFNKKRLNFQDAIKHNGNLLLFDLFLNANQSLRSEKVFCFLNKDFTFQEKIDWNFNLYGKLWTYNLNYFDFLLQSEINKEQGIKLIEDYCKNIYFVKDGLEPYPISLRGINWIKFLSIHKISDTVIENNLYQQYRCLAKNLEYHLLANHLLENGFSLLFAAYFFKDEVFYQKACKILYKELEEQILNDGAHFELSPMYHQIILHRLLDAINLVKNNFWENSELSDFLILKAELMLGWLNTISWKDGFIPLLNDAANGIAPKTFELAKYAEQLGIIPKEIKLNKSGYRKFSSPKYEMIVDVGKIGPDYQPGHAHADTFNFELKVKGVQIVVDTGTSTYETGERRFLERSTSAHNTVEIYGLNQSEIWASHRVGKRASVKLLEDNENRYIAVHDGYKNLKLFHTRSFSRENDSKIIIEDIIQGTNQSYLAIARFHLHPDVSCTLKENDIYLNNSIAIHFDNATQIILIDYLYAPEFNTRIEAKCIEVKFNSILKTNIKL